MPASVPRVLDRRRVLLHRFAAHGLAARSAGPVTGLPVAPLGVQDSPPGSLRIALAARLAATPPEIVPGATVVWSHRGAPHLHPDADLPALAAACWPLSDADAGARLGWQRKRLAEVGGASRAAIRTVAGATAQVLAAGPQVKGELSTAVTRLLPENLSPFCRPCGVAHVGEQLLRLAGLAAGAALQPGTKPVVLEAIPGWPGPPADEAADPAPVVAAYLALCGPASPADVAGFLGTTVTVARTRLPADLVPVTVDGRAALCPPPLLDGPGLEPTGALRLLPPSDPFLQARDREVLLPEAAHRAELWRPIGPPGAVVVDGEITGVWRTRQRGAALDITVTPFRGLNRAEHAALEEEAGRIAEIRGASRVRVA